MSEFDSHDVTPPEATGDSPVANDDALERSLAVGEGDCPPPELIFACAEGVLPEDAAAPIREHIAVCALCRILLAEGAPAGELTPAQSERILARAGASSTVSRVAGNRLRYFAAAAAVLLIVGLAGHYFSRHTAHHGGVAATTPAAQPSSATPMTAAATPPPPATPAWLTAELATVAPLRSPAARASDILERGATTSTPGEPSTAELMPAFRAYNRRDYSTAAHDFSALAPLYPDSSLPALYLGVSQLEIKHNAEAARALAPLVSVASPSPDALWYLAVAEARLGNADAAGLFRRTCDAVVHARPSRHAEAAPSCRIAARLHR